MPATLDIDSMRTLTTIAECGSFTRAARKLNLSQSAVSHKIKRLEQKINRILFNRVDGKLKLSRDGEKMLDYARRLVKLHDEAYASFHHSDLSGELRLGITEDVSAPGMAQILSSFGSNFPNISLSSRVLHTPELVKLLDAGEIDMALIEVFESELRRSDEPLGRQEVVWLQSEDYFHQPGDEIPFVTYHKDCFYKAWAEQALAERDIPMRVVYECPSIDGMINAVRSGLGVGLMNRAVMEQRLSNRRDNRGLKIDRSFLPQPPAIQHVARFAEGLPTRQMNKLLELIKAEVI